MPSLRQIRLATGLIPPRASGGRRSEWTGSKASSLRLLPLANRSLMNRDALVSAQPTRLAEDRFSRFSPAHRADFEGQQRAESEPTRVVLGRSGVRAIAAVRSALMLVAQAAQRQRGGSGEAIIATRFRAALSAMQATVLSLYFLILSRVLR